MSIPIVSVPAAGTGTTEFSVEKTPEITPQFVKLLAV